MISNQEIILKAIDKHKYLSFSQLAILFKGLINSNTIKTTLSRMVEKKEISYLSSNEKNKRFYICNSLSYQIFNKTDFKRFVPNIKGLENSDNHNEKIMEVLVWLREIGQINNDFSFLDQYYSDKEISTFYGKNNRINYVRVFDLWVNQKSGQIAYEIELNLKSSERYKTIFKNLNNQLRGKLSLEDYEKFEYWDNLIWLFDSESNKIRFSQIIENHNPILTYNLSLIDLKKESLLKKFKE